MAKLAPEIEPEPESIFSHRERKATHRLTAALHTTRPSEQSIPQPSMHAAIPINSRKRARQPIAFVGAAAVLLICIGGAFQIGRKFSGHTPQPAALAAVTPPAVPDTAKADLQKKLAVVQKSLDEISARSAEAEKRAAELSDTKASLLAQIDQLTKQDQVTTNSLVATTQQRDALQQQLSDTSKSLQQVNDDLSRARQDRQGAVLRVASLEQEINGLHATLAITDKSASTNEQFLAQDRDIRELMGARQLYIADVLDVQSDGQRSKPFGRVFYTKGKSLVFYAFDLQAQPDYHEAKAFQAWGKPDNPSAKPISLGIFYMDNEKNRRWALKSDNPDALAQIDAVFVTVEPKGGSPRPTGKPFLEAYLHTLPPNHP
ncbi:MAG: anti-sigma factor [Edaphobacter sp.]